MDNVKLIIWTIISVAVISSVGWGYYHISSLLGSKDKTITELRLELAEANNNLSTSKNNVLTLKSSLADVTASYNKLDNEYKLAKSDFEKWKLQDPKIKYVDRVVYDIMTNDVYRDNPDCNTTLQLNEQIKGIRYEDL